MEALGLLYLAEFFKSQITTPIILLIRLLHYLYLPG